jgi:hypothetical protein
MTDKQALVKTLNFQLDIQSDNESLLYDATLESRAVYNETIRLAKQGVDWNAIPDRVADDANLVKNTTQRVVAKALGAMENHNEYDDFSQPSHTKDGAYPLRRTTRRGTTCRSPTAVILRSVSAQNRTNTSRAFSKGVTLTSTFSRLRSRAMSGRSGRQKPCSTTTAPSCMLTSPTPSKPFGTSTTHGRSSAWMSMKTTWL